MADELILIAEILFISLLVFTVAYTIVYFATKKKLDESSENTPTSSIPHEPHKVNVICDYPCTHSHGGICRYECIKVSKDGACLTRVLDVKHIDIRG